MKIKTVQWNIGGAKLRLPEDDPADESKYVNDNLDEIIRALKDIAPDIITLQESHADNNRVQAELISRALGLPYFVNDVYDASHLEEGQGLSQSVISRFPIKDHKFTFYLNPKFQVVRPNGDVWTTHDKGVTSCMLEMGDVAINLKTSHSLPCNKFKIDPLGDAALAFRKDMAEKLRPESERYLFQGDLNYDNAYVKPYLPWLFDGSEVAEVPTNDPTTPRKDRRYDHIFYKGIRHIESRVMRDVLTDHFPIISIFDLAR